MASIREKDFIKRLPYALFPRFVHIGSYSIVPEIKENMQTQKGFVKKENVSFSHFTVLEWCGGPHGIEHSVFKKEPYVRICNEQGCNFEISMDNAFYILNNCETRAVRDGFELLGSFVYVWCANRLFLLPTNTKEYEEILKRRDEVPAESIFLSPDAFVPGKVYAYKDGKPRVYMGMYRNEKNKKTYHFISYDVYMKFKKKEDYSFTSTHSRRVPTSLKDICIGLTSEQISEEDFNAFRDKYEMSGLAYPRDLKAFKKVQIPYEEFEELAKREYGSWYGAHFYADNDEYLQAFVGRVYSDQKYKVFFYKSESTSNSYTYTDASGNDTFTLRECFDIVKPCYCECYLTNGKMYRYELCPGYTYTPPTFK